MKRADHTPPRRIAIVGAGIAGMTLALALDERFEVVLHEAQPGRRGVGAALGLWPSARRSLEALGVRLPAGTPPRDMVLRDLQGRCRLTGRAPEMTMLPRPALIGGLERALPDSIRIHPDRITRPEDLDADLVIGADGVRSRVRPLVWAAAGERRGSAFVALRGTLGEKPAPDTVGEYWGPGRLFGNVPLTDGRYWFTAHRSTLGPEPLEVATVIAEARERFAGTAPVIDETLEQADADTLATRLWVARAMPRYVHGRYLVIGDAAHASMPNLGRGAADAITDALTLAETLNHGRPLARWQLRRVPATQAARALAGAMMKLATRGREPGVSTPA